MSEGASLAVQRYIVGRIIQSIVSMVVVSMVVFALVRLSGDPIQIMAPPEASQADIAAMRAYLGLDRPWAVQYGRFITRALQGDFGQSGRGTPLHIILPGITLGWFAVAGLMRLTRSAMLDVLGTEYVKLARIKGLPERQVIWKHAFKNAALPVVTFAGLVFVALLNGSIIIETVFSWPGVGLLVIEAVDSRDYPIVQTVVLFLSAMYIGVNLMVDVLYAYLNPKIRYSA